MRSLPVRVKVESYPAWKEITRFPVAETIAPELTAEVVPELTTGVPN